MKKKLLSALLTAVLVLSLAACGSSSDGSEKAEDASAESGESNTLTVWAWDQTFNIKAMEMAAEQYAQDHEGFSVDIIETSSYDCQTKLTTCGNSGDYGTLADIILMQDNSYQKYLKSYPDAFTDLTDCGINWNDFTALKQSYSTMDDRHYGVPYDNGVCAGFYRTDILEEAGYTLDDLTDITWSRFNEIGQDLYEKTGKYLLSSTSDGDTIMFMIQSCGANFVDEEGNAFIVGNEIAEKCVDLYVDMIQKNAIKLVNNWDEYVASITNGEVAGVVNGNWMNATLTTVEDQSGLWEITTIPRVDDVDTATNYANNGGSSWYISSNCSNVELAMDFLSSTFGSSTDFYDAILPETSGISCYLPSADSAVYNEPVDFYNGQAIYATLVDYSANIPEYLTTPYHYEAREAVDTAVINIVNGTDKAAALQEAQETLEFKMTE